MENQFDSPLAKDLYVCQLFGFTPKSLIDHVYNEISSVTGDALIEIDKRIRENEELSKYIDITEQQKAFEKIRDAFSARMDLNVDRLELFFNDKIFRVPTNVVLPDDKIQEDCCYTKEDEDKIDQQIAEIKKKIKASYERRIAYQKEISTINELQEKADELLEQMKEYAFDEDYMTSTCKYTQAILEALAASENTESGKSEEIEDTTITPSNKKARHT